MIMIDDLMKFFELLIKFVNGKFVRFILNGNMLC